MRVVDAWVGVSAVLPGLVQFAAGFEGADPERRVDGAQQYGLLIEPLGAQKQPIVTVGHLAHEVVEDHVRRLIDGGGARFPFVDAVLTLGGGDSVAAVGKCDVALEVEPACSRIGIAFNHHGAFPLAAEIEVDVAVDVLFVHVFKAHDAFGGAAHDAIIFAGQLVVGIECRGEKQGAGEEKEGTRRKSHHGFQE